MQLSHSVKVAISIYLAYLYNVHFLFSHYFIYEYDWT